MNGVHDLGGTDGLGPVPVPESEPVYHAEFRPPVRRLLLQPVEHADTVRP